MTGLPILTIITFLPLVGALFLLILPSHKGDLLRQAALTFATLTFLISLSLFFGYDATNTDMQFREFIPWITAFGINYHLGIDGISLLLILLTTVTMPVAILSSWTAITERIKAYMFVLLLLETAMIGVFVSLDLVLFYFFWEAMLIPMAFLIGIWGGENKIYAAYKFFLYTMAGSVLMLVAIIAMVYYGYTQLGKVTFDVLELYALDIPVNWQRWLFLGFFFAFAIKVPMFPFHTWLPDAHVQAPTAGSVILAGIMLKMGTYGFLRFSLGFFPDAAVSAIPYIATLSIIGIIYGALVAMVQPDLKKLVAYSSVSHLGFVMLGMFALNVQGISGSVMQMLNHGVSTGALFLLVGIIYERRHTRMISEFGGLTKQIPIFAVIFMIVTLSSIGLPGLNGFVGEFLILVGVFQEHAGYAAFAASGVILSAVYMLWMFQRVMFGKLENPANKLLKDINFREIIVLTPFIILIFWMGIYPKTFLDKMEPSVQKIVERVESRVDYWSQAK
ncbi:MAG: NADH-quinone oxidoreductase subunit M [Gemmatimonadetes bacterium]|nr:MAG: NADH-quinone oxidoreductase subunit M [Gemmatimonadota bacterium]